MNCVMSFDICHLLPSACEGRDDCWVMGAGLSSADCFALSVSSALWEATGCASLATESFAVGTIGFLRSLPSSSRRLDVEKVCRKVFRTRGRLRSFSRHSAQVHGVCLLAEDAKPPFAFANTDADSSNRAPCLVVDCIFCSEHHRLELTSSCQVPRPRALSRRTFFVGLDLGDQRTGCRWRLSDFLLIGVIRRASSRLLTDLQLQRTY